LKGQLPALIHGQLTLDKVQILARYPEIIKTQGAGIRIVPGGARISMDEFYDKSIYAH
jgi:hypothetical protein